MASSFKRKLSVKGKTITLMTRTEGASGYSGNPAITWPETSIKARVFPVRADDVQLQPGRVLNDYRILHLAIDTGISLMSRFKIDNVVYEMDGPPIIRDTYQQVLLRRLGVQ
jgi:hypothetical protein